MEVSGTLKDVLDSPTKKYLSIKKKQNYENFKQQSNH